MSSFSSVSLRPEINLFVRGRKEEVVAGVELVLTLVFMTGTR